MKSCGQVGEEISVNAAQWNNASDGRAVPHPS
jgi:hypothetical protein